MPEPKKSRRIAGKKRLADDQAKNLSEKQPKSASNSKRQKSSAGESTGRDQPQAETSNQAMGNKNDSVAEQMNAANAMMIQMQTFMQSMTTFMNPPPQNSGNIVNNGSSGVQEQGVGDVQTAITSHILGGNGSGSGETPTRHIGISSSFTSVATPLDAHVPLKINKKIWVNEYIEFSELIKQNNVKPKSIQIAPGFDGEDPLTLSFGFVPNPKVATFAQWQSVFSIFATIILQRSPELAVPLFRYGATLKDLADKEGNWYYYDYYSAGQSSTCRASSGR
jgi:hypothetical protein